MKHYKLKNDLPTFKAGYEFYLDDNNDLYLKDPVIMAYSHTTLEKFPDILTDWFEEIEENTRWRANPNEEYWYIDECGETFTDYDWRNPEDNYRYSVGNYSKTERETEAYKKYLIARQVLLDDAEGGKFILGGKNWIGAYVYITGLCYHDSWDRHLTQNYLPGMIYFRTEEALLKSLKEHKEQWEIVRKYEMGEKLK